jgi:predicted nucleic acid-binding Zn ribbon protein
METMGGPTVEVLCKDCGKTFTAFLQEMADKNAVVTCPCCGKGQSRHSDHAVPPAAQN